MFSTLLSVTLLVSFAIQGALAFSVDTPKLVQCKSVSFDWEKTKGPYDLAVVSSTNPCGDVLRDLGDISTNRYTWRAVNFPAGTKLQFSILDANDGEGWSREMVVGPSNNDSCLATSTSTSSSSSPTPPADDGTAPVPVGAANAADFPFGSDKSSGALGTRQLSTPAIALGLLVAAVATFTL